MSARTFGFDPTTVFGDVRKTAKKTRKKRKDDMTDMMADSISDNGLGLGIDTFSLGDPKIDPLGIGEDFGARIGAPAGQANGKGSLVGEGGFLGVIGRQEAKGVPSVLGTAKKQRRIGKRTTVKKLPRSVARSPLQARSGSRFGNLDDKFGEVFFSNIAGARKRIANFREGRRTPREDPPMLEFKEQTIPAKEARETPMLPAPPESPRSETRPIELARGRAPT